MRTRIWEVVRRAGYRLASRLPPPRDEALRRLGLAIRDLVAGRSSRPFVPDDSAPLPNVERVAVNDVDWRSPPPVPETGRVGGGATVAPEVTPFDLGLFEQLNEEYADRPLSKNPPKYDPEALAEKGRTRMLWVHNMIDLREKRVLEIGCGNGYEVWNAAHHLGSEAHGIDIVNHATWDALADDRVSLRQVDLANHNPYPDDYFDRIMSFTVWEHVRHPHATLAETYRILKPGGLVWMRANLFAGPKASHRSRYVHFPWPHLLFTEGVMRQWQRKHGYPENGFGWVNRLAWHHYRFYFDQIGFRVRHVKFDRTPIDEAFYRRFEEHLGKYPRWDLQTDFFLVVLEKPA